MFDNLNMWELGALFLLAFLIFGDRLPKVIADGLRMLRNLRSMANDATGDLRQQLGTDIQLEDLNPKALLRKHVLSEADEEALRRPLRGLYDEVRADVGGVRDDVEHVRSGLRSGSGGVGTPAASAETGPAEIPPTEVSPPPVAPRGADYDAT
ncbi:preprotein translocase subunit TatB [Pilimelia columellifera]|uniref:Sec-independent translocase n=1 Tax=Pilimelia columellifera subsp. columellifera TaxID=706583 RepID=A0ABN3NK81_9ACTN